MNNPDALRLAKFNVEKFYPVVGITENIDMTLKVLEVKMPQYFKDAYNEYHTNVGVMSKRNINRDKKNVSPEVIQQLKQNLTNEYEFYYFCMQRLDKQYKSILK